MKIGISLSGGGARGFAHIGVLKALEEHDIFPEVIAGTSAGAIVGALYAAGKTPDEMLDFVSETSIFKIFRVALPNKGLASLDYLRERLVKVIPDDDFASLQKDLYVAVTNLKTGKLEIKNTGLIYETVMASSAIPLVFKPVEIDGQLYVDGGVLNNMPTKPLLRHADAIIGVNVMPNIPVDDKTVNGMIGIAARVFEMSIWANTRPNLQRCDVVIEPTKVIEYNIFNFNRQKEIYELGYEAALEKMPFIKEKLEEKLLAISQV